ncbi:hypothetical protein [Algoriphagus machipongonensis]|uniref:Uncharacterized protein n=1 Tax=Algoriphagus machipongonensis TaxID=388413 RepID=A3HV50_9BACT|nr:hypothetical protein [Algoriphagus machipongonensis]EAZ82022.1 hypothetical protein ALPR1_02235 [Algoriphagus machipongonensis]
MKSIFKPLAFFSLFFLGISSLGFAQKSLQEIAELNDKKWDKLVKNYRNYSNSIDQLQGLLNVELLAEENLPNPKKIGVLSMQVWDYSVTNSSKVAQTTVYQKNFLTPEGSNLVADHFLESILPIFQDQFQAKGIALVEPSEFLTDEEKRKIYEEGGSRIETSGLVKTLGSITSFLYNSKMGEGSVAASGYEFYPISVVNMSTDFKAPATLGLLVEDLDLDAVLILSVGVSLVKNGRTMVLHKIEAAIVGPIDDDQSKEYKGRIGAGMMNMYRDGLNYSSVMLEVEPFEVAKINKSEGAIEEWQLDGLDVVSKRMAADLIRGMEKFIALDKSKD